MIGEHSVHVLKALGYSAAEIEALMDPKQATEKVEGVMGKHKVNTSANEAVSE